MELSTVWFILIAVLWTGYLVLEGFDFGVGMLLPVLGRKDVERRVMINTVGPVWDGNEVWLLTAGGATFAAFPEWYATMFSGFYLALLLILLGLIVRVVAFEWRGKIDDDRWRRVADRALIVVDVQNCFTPGGSSSLWKSSWLPSTSTPRSTRRNPARTCPATNVTRPLSASWPVFSTSVSR